MKMVQQNRKTIVVTERNFETLRKMGNVTESFNDVITRLIEKAAMSGQSLAGVGQSTATALQSTNPKGVIESS
jgi:Putative antitoxin